MNYFKYLRKGAVGLLTTALAVFLWRWARLLFSNTHSPINDWGWSLLISIFGIVLTLLVSYGIIYGLRKLSKFSLPVFTIVVLAMVGIGWLIYPVPCDTHESFQDVENKLCECNGLEVTHYPPGVMDYHSTDYCIGFESSPDSSRDTSIDKPESGAEGNSLNTQQHKSCTSDDQCVLITTDCATGCPNEAVNKDHEDKFRNYCEDYTGPVSARPCIPKKAVCEDNKCKAKAKNNY